MWGPDQDNEDVALEVEALALSVLEGQHACVLAYGQTGSGKTHTMSGTDEVRAGGREGGRKIVVPARVGRFLVLLLLLVTCCSVSPPCLFPQMQDPGMTYRFLARLMEVVQGPETEEPPPPRQHQQALAPAEERSEGPPPPQAPQAGASGWRVSLSMVEVYNDEIRDLLSSSGSGSNSLDIRRDAEGALLVRGVLRQLVARVKTQMVRP